MLGQKRTTPLRASIAQANRPTTNGSLARPNGIGSAAATPTKPRPLLPTSSSSALPALDPAYHSQLTDLVNRNRDLELTIQKLNTQILTEASRFKSQLENFRKEHQADTTVFEHTLTRFHACFQLVVKEMEVEKLRERGAVWKEMEEARREKFERLKRDYRIASFQIVEGDWVRRVEDVEEEKEILENEMTKEVEEWKTETKELRALLKAKEKEVKKFEAEREKLVVCIVTSIFSSQSVNQITLSFHTLTLGRISKMETKTPNGRHRVSRHARQARTCQAPTRHRKSAFR